MHPVFTTPNNKFSQINVNSFTKEEEEEEELNI